MINKLIYVDAGNSNNHISFKKYFKLSLVDLNENIEETSELKVYKTTNTKAEYIAILNALNYILSNKYNEIYKVIIHSDNKNIVNKSELQSFCILNNIELKWIPREDNFLADLLTKKDENKLLNLEKINELEKKISLF